MAAVLFALPLLLAAGDPPCADPYSNYGQVLRERGVPVCEGPKAPPPVRQPSAAEQKVVRTYFDDVLLDGPSARWRFTGVWRDGSICGQVNAKNRLGGYTGWTGFFYRKGEGGLTESDGQLHWSDQRKFDCILPREPLGMSGF